MIIFRIEHDINRYLGFCREITDAEDFVKEAMRRNQSLSTIWQGCRASLIPGKTGDFATSPYSAFAPIALNKKALTALEGIVAQVAELLPFHYKKQDWWMLYLPTPVDCLDEEGTVYCTDHISPDNIRKAAFRHNNLPSQHIFRVPGGYDYFVTKEFKRIVEEHALTGLKFELMWSDEPIDTASNEEPSGAPRAEERRVRKPGRRSKRDRLLDRLWQDVINHRQSDRWWQEVLESLHERQDDSASLLNDAGKVLEDAIQRGVSADDLKRMARSLAYQIVFDTLIAIEEEGADRGPALRCLHEDLLMANPDGYEE